MQSIPRRAFLLALIGTIACGKTETASSADGGSDAAIDAEVSLDASSHTCSVGGKEFAVGERIVTERDCGLCTCTALGLKCNQGVCPGTCEYGGKQYEAGSSFLSDDGCNSCACNVGSIGVLCTAKGACTYEGKGHCIGVNFKSADGCNDCVCTDDSEVSCTKRACAHAGADAE